MSSKMKFRFINFALTSIIILAADLTIAFANKSIMKYSGLKDKRVIVIAGMALVLAIFYIALKWINRVSEWFTEKFVHVVRLYLGRSMGLFISVVLLLFVLFAGYYYVWFNGNIFSEISIKITF